MEQARTHTSAASAAAAASSSPPPPKTTSSSTTATTTATTTTSTSNTASGAVKQSSPPSSSASSFDNLQQDKDVDMDIDGSINNASNAISRKGHSPLGKSRNEEDQEEEEEKDAEMDDENGSILPNGSILVKEYTEASSSMSRTGGVITPHNIHFTNSDTDNDNEQDINTNLFKQFDSKTGQFLGNQRGQTLAMNPLTFKDQQQNVLPSNTPTSMASAASSLRLYAKGKFRSHSVPTISHSSLRRLTSCNNHAHYHYHHNQSTNHALVNSGGVKKKKIMKNIHHNHCTIQETPITNPEDADRNITGEENTASCSTTANPNSIVITKPAVANSSSLRNAILLCHQAPSLTKYQEFSLQERINYIKSQATPLPLPPINLQCLKEIDLQEIVKNPQLRHDIIFDPLLQFRPNLDGERGIKKKNLADKYWNDVENEIFVYSQRPEIFQYSHTRLVPLFDTLREVLLTIVPQREAHVINNVLDTELNVQELLKGSLIMTSLSEWLAQLFKHHCAPMRDAWVDKMSLKFKEAELESSLSKLIDGLRLVFQILEAMKLDIANHQIRILRTALLSNSVEFEKQYFQSLMASNRVNLKSSLAWFNRKYDESESLGKLVGGKTTPQDVYKLCIRSVISLLSCRKMVREYPTSLSFDHARLILLRADIRQIVCLLICRLLFKQLVANDSTIDKATKDFINASYTTKKLKNEIVSIITDEHGNCRWTKNTMSIAIHLCKTINDLKTDYQKTGNDDDDEEISSVLPATPSLDTAKVDFAKSWLSRQTQPLSEVYGVLENRVFKSLEDSIFNKSSCTMDGRVKQDFVYLCSNINNGSTTGGTGTTAASANSNTAMMTPPREGTRSLMSIQTQASSAITTHQNAFSPAVSSPISSSTISGSDTQGNNAFHGLEMEEFENVYRHLYTVVNFHWSVFGCHYMEALGGKMEKRAL